MLTVFFPALGHMASTVAVVMSLVNGPVVISAEPTPASHQETSGEAALVEGIDSSIDEPLTDAELVLHLDLPVDLSAGVEEAVELRVD